MHPLALVLAGAPLLEAMPVPAGDRFDPGLACYAAVEPAGRDPIVESLFSLTRGTQARLAVRLIAGLENEHALAALASIACAHPEAPVRAEAADELADLPARFAGEAAFVLALAHELEEDPEVRDILLADLERVAERLDVTAMRARAVASLAR